MALMNKDINLRFILIKTDLRQTLPFYRVLMSKFSYFFPLWDPKHNEIYWYIDQTTLIHGFHLILSYSESKIYFNYTDGRVSNI